MTQLAIHAASADGALGWRDMRADPRADARTLLKLYAAVEASEHVAGLLRRALAVDRAEVERLLARWNGGEPPTPVTYRRLVLASTRVQAALWHPSGWWFALW